MLKLATWNVNSIRKRLPLLLDWLSHNHPDIMCLQETKVQDTEFPVDAIRDAGYHCAFRGEKSYNGVATLTRRAPENVFYGFDEGPDREDVRLIEVTVDGLQVINSYVPQGFRVGTDKYAYKLEWFRRIRGYFEDHLDARKNAIWTGDLNVAPQPIDVYHPDRRINDPDFHIAAREAYAEAVKWGFVDVFRKLHPERVQYTYWDYYRNALDNNWGWRIDHILATPPLAELCRMADVDMAPRRGKDASDHTVLWAQFEI
jgi:exodeoxyribonuclease-3